MMSRCYLGALQPKLRNMSSTEEGNSASVTKEAEEDVDQTVSTTSHGTETMDSQAFPLNGKRKKLDALAAIFTSDTSSLSNKRRRDKLQPSSSSSTGVGLRGRSHYKKGGSCDPVETRETRGKTHFSHSVESSGLSRLVSPPSFPTEGKKAITGRNSLSVFHEATSAQGSGLANQSTVTTSSTKDEEDSTSLHSFGQTSKVARQTEDTVNLIGPIKTIGIGSIGSRQAGTHEHHEKTVKHSRLNCTQRNMMKDRKRDRQPKCEVMSPISNIFANLMARDAEVDRVSGSLGRDASYEERSGRTETTCVLNSGCSIQEAGRRELVRRSTDYGSFIRQCDDSSRHLDSSCSREVQSVVSGPSLCVSSCSNSMPSELVTPYQPYRPMAPSRMKQSDLCMSSRNSVTVDEILAAEGLFIANNYKGKKSAVTPENSHAPSNAASSSALERETGNSSSPITECKFAGVDRQVHDDAGPQLAPTFVLSSGRMSMGEAKKLGLRPSTIDDDFDEYFAQLML